MPERLGGQQGTAASVAMARDSSRRLSLGLAIAVLAVAAAFVVALLARYEDDRQAATAEIRQDARFDAVVADRLVRDGISLLNSLAVTDTLRSGNPAQVSALFDRANPVGSGLTGGIAWVDASGTLLSLSGESDPAPASFTDRDWFQAAQDGKRFVGRAVRSRVRAGAPAVTLAVPSLRDDGPPNVVAGAFLLDRRGEFVSALGAADSRRLILDRAGQIIVGEGPGADVLRRRVPDSWPPVGRRSPAGARAGVTDPLGNQDRVVAWSAVPSAGWVAIRSVPAGTAFGEARRTLIGGLAAVAMAVVLLLGAIWFVSRRLRRRLASSVESARRQDVLADAMDHVAEASTQFAVAQAVVDEALPALDARGGSIWMLDDDRAGPVALHRFGDDRSAPTRPNHSGIATDTPSGAAIAYATPVYVSDSDLGRRFPEAMRAEGVRVWAAAPLLDGPSVIGVLTATYADPRALDPESTYAFELLAERTSAALLRVRRHERDHEAALAFQQSLLGQELDTVDGVVIDAVYLPGDVDFGVGGDWYDTVRIDDHRLLVMVGDVVGRGVDAAGAMGQLRAAARALAPRCGPAELLDALSALAERRTATVGTSMCCVLIDTASLTLEYSHAGHLPGAAVHADGTVTLLEIGQRTLLGIHAGPAGQQRLSLQGLRALVLYSDGLIERRDESIDAGLDRLTRILADSPSSATAIAQRCRQDSQARDDAVVVYVDVTEAAARGDDLLGDADASPSPAPALPARAMPVPPVQ